MVSERLESVDFLFRLDSGFIIFISETKDVCPIYWAFYRLKVINPCQR
ncbi:MAG: hypothetical protein ACFFEU_02260 [Candidatus Thorarchaeota archaeon]